MANEVVRYIGARYVPIYVGNWDSTISYEPLSIVTDNVGNSYTSRKTVPAGTMLSNEEYWAQTGVFNAQLADIKDDVEKIEERISVSYSQFGAVLDGITDDSVAVLAAHQYANANGLKVEQHSGRLLLNFTVDVFTDCDFSGMTFVMTDSTPDICYNIPHDGEGSGTLAFTLSRTSENYPTDLYGKFCVPYLASSSTSLGVRGQGTPLEYYHRQPLAVDKLGYRLTALYFLNETQGAFELRGLSDLNERGICFCGGTVENSMTLYKGWKCFVRVNRNNSIVERVVLKPVSTPVSGSTTADKGAIRIHQCCHATVRNITGLNHAFDAVTSDPYVLAIYESWDVSIYDCSISSGWGVMVSYFVDTINFHNNCMNRFDNHYGLFGEVAVRDSYLTAGPNRINLGYGEGVVSISGIALNPSVDSNTLIMHRGDFPITYEGTLIVDGIQGRIPSSLNSLLGFESYGGESTANSNRTRVREDIFVSNCETRRFSTGNGITGHSVEFFINNCMIFTVLNITAVNYTITKICVGNCDINDITISGAVKEFYVNGGRIYGANITFNTTHTSSIVHAVLSGVTIGATNGAYSFTGGSIALYLTGLIIQTGCTITGGGTVWITGSCARQSTSIVYGTNIRQAGNTENITYTQAA